MQIWTPVIHLPVGSAEPSRLRSPDMVIVLIEGET